MRRNGMHFIGDVKTGSAHYPTKEIQAATAAASGSWATFTSELKLGGDKLMPIFAISHRRGEAVHTFVSTCGTSLKGNAVMAYFEDDEERCNAQVNDFEISRSAARVHNDYTLAQPCSDRHNRYRQVCA